MRNQPFEDYPKFFPPVIPRPPPPPASFFTIPPPPDFSTIVPPTEKPNSNGVLIALIIILAIILAIVVLLLLYKWWKKEAKESQQHVEKHNANRVSSSKNSKKSSVRERDIVYEHDRRLSESNGRLMEARYGKRPKRESDYEADLESGFDDMYLSSGDESNFYSEKLMIDRKSNAYKGEENTSSKPKITHNGQTKEESAEDAAISNDIVTSICDKVDTKSNDYEREEDVHSEPETIHDRQSECKLAKDSMTSDAAISNDIVLSICDKVDTKSNAYEREEDVYSEPETIHDRQSECKLAKDSMRSDAPESDLESALGETGASKKSKPGKPKNKKGKSRAG